MKPYLIILYLISCVCIGALSDANHDTGVKMLGHTLGALEVLMLISAAFVFNLPRRKWIPLVLSYVFWRIVGFDYLYNLFAGLPWDYVGTTSLWDRITSTVPPFGLISARVVFLAAAVFIPIREL